MEAKQRNQFPKGEHLKSRKQIDQLFTAGKSFFVHPLKVYWKVTGIDETAPHAVKAGVSTSKRNFKKAVDRNRVKRLLRETYRLNKQDLADLTASQNISLQVFFIYVDKSLPTFDGLEMKMISCLKKLKRIVEDA